MIVSGRSSSTLPKFNKYIHTAKHASFLHPFILLNHMSIAIILSMSTGHTMATITTSTSILSTAVRDPTGQMPARNLTFKRSTQGSSRMPSPTNYEPKAMSYIDPPREAGAVITSIQERVSLELDPLRRSGPTINYSHLCIGTLINYADSQSNFYAVKGIRIPLLARLRVSHKSFGTCLHTKCVTSS